MPFKVLKDLWKWKTSSSQDAQILTRASLSTGSSEIIMSGMHWRKKWKVAGLYISPLSTRCWVEIAQETDIRQHKGHTWTEMLPACMLQALPIADCTIGRSVEVLSLILRSKWLQYDTQEGQAAMQCSTVCHAALQMLGRQAAFCHPLHTPVYKRECIQWVALTVWKQAKRRKSICA